MLKSILKTKTNSEAKSNNHIFRLTCVKTTQPEIGMSVIKKPFPYSNIKDTEFEFNSDLQH